jgi:hypothetical protein
LLAGGSTFIGASAFEGVSLPAGFFSGSLQLKNITGNNVTNRIFFITNL